MEQYKDAIKKRLLNVKDTAEYLNKTIDGLYQMTSKKQIPFVKIGRSIYFDIERLDKWIKEKTIEEVKG